MKQVLYSVLSSSFFFSPENFVGCKTEEAGVVFRLQLEPDKNKCCIDLGRRGERRAANLIDCTRVVPSQLPKKPSSVLALAGL